MSVAERIESLYAEPAPAPSTSVAALLEELDSELLRGMRIGYIKVSTRATLRLAAVIGEVLAARGEVLP